MLSHIYSLKGILQVYPGETTFRTCVEYLLPSTRKSSIIFLVLLSTMHALIPGDLYLKFFYRNLPKVKKLCLFITLSYRFTSLEAEWRIFALRYFGIWYNNIFRYQSPWRENKFSKLQKPTEKSSFSLKLVNQPY